MSDNSVEHRLYGDLAEWWPLISPVEEYAEEAGLLASILKEAPSREGSGPVREVLDLGSGGGHLAAHLKGSFSMTLTDISEAMLRVSRRLNPECDHRQGDMRVLRLGRAFDAVVAHDAIAYMTTRDDLRMAVETAFAHCRPGGTAVFVPDDIAETFRPGTEHGGRDAANGRGARFLSWSWDPDRADAWTLTAYAFLLREVGGTVRAVHETHREGLFGWDTWHDLMTEAGFEVSGRIDPPLFIGRRPDHG